MTGVRVNSTLLGGQVEAGERSQEGRGQPSVPLPWQMAGVCHVYVISARTASPRLLPRRCTNTAGIHTLSGDLISRFIGPTECQPRKAARRGRRRGAAAGWAGLLLNTRAQHPATRALSDPNALEEISLGHRASSRNKPSLEGKSSCY